MRAAIAELLGGQRWLGGSALDNPFALHNRLARGLPARALTHFVRHFPLLAKDPALARVLGSAAALPAGTQSARSSRISSHESGQLWRLAGVLTKTALLLGDWRRRSAGCCTLLSDSAAGRPLDLMVTAAGQLLVAEHLV